MATGIRFDPPRIALEPEARWLVARAFGPTGAPVPGTAGLDLARLVDVGTSMDLLPRVGARTPLPLLRSEVGVDGAETVRSRFQVAAALAVQGEGLAREVVEAADELGVPVVLLKGTALHVLGLVEPGARASCDVDLLVPADRAEELQRRLLAAGFRDSGMPRSEHQLPAIVHPAGVVLEIHTMVWGVRLGGAGPSASAGALMASGLCRQVARLGRQCFVPRVQVLLSHVLVHGIAQHGLAPLAYPMTRMLADVQDLALGGEGWRHYLAGPLAWIASDVTGEEAAAVAGLVRRLASGEDPAAIVSADSDSSIVLRHIVAGLTDARYREAIKLRALGAPQVEGSRAGALAAAAVKAVWLTDAQIDAVYGRPRSRAGYWGRRLWRPFDLVLRAVRYAWAAVAYRRAKRIQNSKFKIENSPAHPVGVRQ